jgi:hypothetical protein
MAPFGILKSSIVPPVCDAAQTSHSGRYATLLVLVRAQKALNHCHPLQSFRLSGGLNRLLCWASLGVKFTLLRVEGAVSPATYG